MQNICARSVGTLMRQYDPRKKINTDAGCPPLNHPFHRLLCHHYRHIPIRDLRALVILPLPPLLYLLCLPSKMGKRDRVTKTTGKQV